MSKINWSRALHDYASDESMSYAKIAEKYGVSVDAVKAKGEEEGWVEIRAETKQKLLQKIPEKVADKLAAINDVHLNLGRLLQSKGVTAIEMEGIKPKTARDAREYILDGIAIERKALGIDRPETQTQVNIQNNTYMSTNDLFIKIQERVNTDEPATTENE